MASEPIIIAGVALSEGLLGAIIGGLIGFIGAVIGAVAVWYSAKQTVEKQIEAQRQRDEEEAKRQARYIIQRFIFAVEQRGKLVAKHLINDGEWMGRALFYSSIPKPDIYLGREAAYIDDVTMGFILTAENRIRQVDAEMVEVLEYMRSRHRKNSSYQGNNDENVNIHKHNIIELSALTLSLMKVIRKSWKLDERDKTVDAAEAAIKRYAEKHGIDAPSESPDS